MTSPLARDIAEAAQKRIRERIGYVLAGRDVPDIAALIDARLAPVLEAMAFAASVIKCGEPWTKTCEERIGAALALLRPAEAKR